MTDDESETDRANLQKLEEHMLNLGYRRDRYGFWTLPGSPAWYAAPQEQDDE